MADERDSPYREESLHKNVHGVTIPWSLDRKGLRALAIRMRDLMLIIDDLPIRERVVLRTGTRRDRDAFREYLKSVASGAISSEYEIGALVAFGARLEGIISGDIRALFESCHKAFSGTARRIEIEGPMIYEVNRSEILGALSEVNTLLQSGCQELRNFVVPYNHAHNLLVTLLEGVRDLNKKHEIDADNKALLEVLF